MKHLYPINEFNSYDRVIPRDFFNESKLLKCMGQLMLKIHDGAIPDGMDIKIEETGDPFEIIMTDWGGLCVINYPVTINGEDVSMETNYNSKAPYPMYCVYNNAEFEVFNDKGEFTEDFKNMMK